MGSTSIRSVLAIGTPPDVGSTGVTAGCVVVVSVVVVVVVVVVEVSVVVVVVVVAGDAAGTVPDVVTKSLRT